MFTCDNSSLVICALAVSPVLKFEFEIVVFASEQNETEKYAVNGVIIVTEKILLLYVFLWISFPFFIL